MRHNQLKAFDTVALEGSFSQAAIRLGVTQPAVTYQVRALELEYECILFNRARSGAELTDEGRALFKITRKLFEAELEAREYLDAAHQIETGTLRLAADAPQFALDLIEPFVERFPKVQISISFGNTREVRQDLMDKRVDAIVTGNPPDDDGAVITPFHRHELCAIIGKGHALSGRSEIGVKDLSGQRILMREEISTTRQDIERYFAEHKFSADQTMELGSREAIKEAASKGLGIGFMFRREAEGDNRIIVKSLAGKSIYSTNALMCLKAQQNRQIIRELIKTAEALGQLTGPAPE